MLSLDSFSELRVWQNTFATETPPRTRWRAYTLPSPLAGFREMEKDKDKKRKGKERETRGKGSGF